MRYDGILVSAVAVLTLTAARVLSLPQSPQDRSGVEVLSVADLATLIARSGGSAGFVVELPESLNSKLAQLKNQATLGLADRSAFNLWVRDTRTVWQRPGRVITPPTSPEGVVRFLRQYAARRPLDHWMVATGPNGRMGVLKTGGASACELALQRQLRADVEGRELNDVASKLVKSASDATVSRGWVGSCISASQFREEPLRLGAGQTLEEALNAAVESFGGVVWVAVRARGECSLGLISRSEAGGACMASITANLR